MFKDFFCSEIQANFSPILDVELSLVFEVYSTVVTARVLDLWTVATWQALYTSVKAAFAGPRGRGVQFFFRLTP